MAVITLISFSRTFVGLLKDHAVAVFYDLTTRTQSKSSYTTSVDSTAALGWVSTRRSRTHGEGVVPPYVVVPVGSARLLARI